MDRKSRIDAHRALHHITVRGIERRSIFVDAHDYTNFLQRLGNLLTVSSTGCYARSRAVISIVAIEQMGFSGADIARVLNIKPSAVSKLVLRARNGPALKGGINNVINLL